MKLKLLMIIIIALSLINIVSAYTEVEYSVDNLTWDHAAFTNTNNVTLEVLNNGIDEGKQYYFRIKHVYTNGSSDWSYINQNTKFGGEKGMILASIILLPIILGIFMLVGAITLDSKEHNVLKIFLFLMSFIMIFLSMNFGLTTLIKFYDFPELQNLIGNSTFWMGSIFVIIISYFIIYFIYTVFTHIQEKKKQRLKY